MNMFFAMQEQRVSFQQELIHVGQKTDKHSWSPFTETHTAVQGTRVHPAFRPQGSWPHSKHTSTETPLTLHKRGPCSRPGKRLLSWTASVLVLLCSCCRIKQHFSYVTEVIVLVLTRYSNFLSSSWYRAMF